MDFLGIGPLELVAIFLIIFLVMGPSDIVKMGSTLGKTLRNIRKSEMWTAMQRAQKELRSLPDTLAKQVNLDDMQELKKEIEGELAAQKKEIQDMDREFVAWTRTDGKGEKSKEDDEEKKTTSSKVDKSAQSEEAPQNKEDDES